MTGHLLDRVTDMQAFVTEDEKHVKRIDLEPDVSGKVSFSTVLPKAPGRYFIDITSRDPAELSPDPAHPWGNLLLWLPLYVGVPEPAAPDAFIGHPAPNKANTLEMAAQILDVYDAERARLGLPPLVRNAALSDAAARRAFFAAQQAGDRVPPDPELGDIAARLGLGSRTWQKQTTFLFAEEYAQMELMKPHHRAFILDREVVVGAGIALRKKKSRAEGEQHQRGTPEKAAPMIFEGEEYYVGGSKH